MQESIVLGREQRDELVRHAEDCCPNESCALFFGTGMGGRVLVREIFFARNAAESPSEFVIPDEQLIEAYKTAGERGLDVVGVFHSHPDSDAVPSITDAKFMDTNPVVWVIYSGRDKSLRAYLPDSMREIPIIYGV